MARITETKVRALKPKDSRYTLSDGGLVVEVLPSGRKTFYHSYRHAGKRYKEKLGNWPTISVSEAKKKVGAKQHEIQTQGIPGAGSEVKFKDFLEDQYLVWADTNHKNPKKTRRVARDLFIRSWFGEERLKDITPQKIEKLKAEWVNERGVGKATLRIYLAALRGALNKAIQWGLLNQSPMKPVKVPSIDDKKTRLYLSDHELESLLREIAEWREVNLQHEQEIAKGIRLHPDQRVLTPYTPYLVILALNTGMRKGELLSLQWSDFDMFRKVVIVRGKKSKSGKSREIPVSEKVLDAVDEWARLSRDLDSPAEDKVFNLVSYGTPNGWKHLRERAGLQHIVFHQLRHHFCTTLCLRGAPLHVVKELAGHSSIITTQRYLGARLKDKVEAVNLL